MTASFEYAEFMLKFVYFGIVVVGLPAYLILRRWRMASIWIAALIGLVASPITALLFGLVMSFPAAFQNAQLWSFFFARLLKMVVDPFSLSGALIGMVFWYIARPDQTSRVKMAEALKA